MRLTPIRRSSVRPISKPKMFRLRSPKSDCLSRQDRDQMFVCLGCFHALHKAISNGTTRSKYRMKSTRASPVTIHREVLDRKRGPEDLTCPYRVELCGNLGDAG